MRLDKYYRDTVLVPAGFIVAGYAVFALVCSVFDRWKDFKILWMTANTVLLYAITIIILNLLVLGILSAGIFLNEYRKVRNHILLTLVTWFLLPCCWIGFLLFKTVQYLLHAHKWIDGESIFVFTNTLPFLAALILSYSKFRQAVNRNDGNTAGIAH